MYCKEPLPQLTFDKQQTHQNINQYLVSKPLEDFLWIIKNYQRFVSCHKKYVISINI